MFGNQCTSQYLMKPLSDTTELSGWANRPFNLTWPEEIEPYNNTLVTKILPKKSKRTRTAFTTDQLLTLEEMYNKYKYVNARVRRELGHKLNIKDSIIKVWFQNRRCKEKKQQSSGESSNESLSPDESATSASEKAELPAQPVSIPQHQYSQSYIFPTQIENPYDASAQSVPNAAESSCNYLSGYHLPYDTSSYPTPPANHPDSTAYYPYTEQYLNFTNTYENTYAWPAGPEFNINEQFGVFE